MRSRMRSAKSQGAALLTILAFITLMAVMLLAFLALTRTDRKSTFNYSQSLKADEIGLSALQEITSGLLQEIEAGSKKDGDPANAVYTQNGVRVYVPRTRVSSQPARLGFNFPADFGTDIGTLLPPTLIRVSRFGATYTNTAINGVTPYDTTIPLPAALASDVSTGQRSSNGRQITAEAWNRPMFMGTTSIPTPFQNNLPDWIYVTRAGSKVLADVDADDGKLKQDSVGSNQTAVLGRYAYVIYDEGGTLDINVAGYPSSAASSPEIGWKSFLTYADLGKIPGFDTDRLDELIKWRDKKPLDQPYADFLSRVPIFAASGFLDAGSTNPFLGRQDLLAYFEEMKLDPRLLPYLGTSNRSINSPSYFPSKNAIGTDYQYLSNAEDSFSTNRAFANVRFIQQEGSVIHFADNGTQTSYSVKIGEPLLRRRFSLAKIGWLTKTGPKSGISDAAIRNCFGLSWNSTEATWDYVAGISAADGSLKTLAEVAAELREPNFFELLKAAILEGSLGQHPGQVGGYGAMFGGGPYAGPVGALFGGTGGYSLSPDRHIFQIGANIIDQHDDDSYPTAIYQPLPGGGASTPELARYFKTLYGQENLPYLSKLIQFNAISSATPNEVLGWYQPEIWNPNQSANGTLDDDDRPKEFRIRCHGSASTCVWVGGNVRLSPVVNFDSSPELGCLYFNDASGLVFSPRPVLLTTANATSSNPLNLSNSTYPPGSPLNPFAAINTGKYTKVYDPAGFGAFTCGNPELTISIEYKDGTAWRPYTFLARLRVSESHGYGSGASYGSVGNIHNYPRPDPRTDRFSVSIAWENEKPPVNSTFRPSGTSNYRSVKAWPRKPADSPGGIFSYGSNRYYMANLAVNQNLGTTQSAYYTDLDGIVRPGDAFRGKPTSTDGDGWPTFTTGTDGGVLLPRRPIILNRPFKSVGELGYVFRDLPFKSLDFWSSESADAALLDTFSVSDEPELIAGEINPNAALAPILAAVIAGATKQKIDPAIKIGSEAISIAESITKAIQTNPLQNRADYVTQFSDTINTALVNSTDMSNKAYAESTVRALAPVTNTRTWNLMIDLVAQSGRIAPAGKTLAEFVVEGEKRCWLHIAVDRYTGKIIRQQVESILD